MKSRSVFLLVVLFLTTTASESHAFFRWLRELSGPGPFLGVSFFAPRRLFFNERQLDLHGLSSDERRAIFELFDVDPVEPEPRLSGVSAAYRRALHDVFGVDVVTALERLSRETDPRERELDIASIARLAGLSQPELERLFTLRADDAGQELFEALAPRYELLQTRRIQRSIERIGGRGGLGFFGIKRAIPPFLQNSRGSMHDTSWWLNFSFTAARSLENDLRYSPANDRDKGVWWFSLTPSIEYRRPLSSPREVLRTSDPEVTRVIPKIADVNLFVNTGIGVDHFVGDAFPNFTTYHWKTKAGVGYKMVQAGVQFNYFLKSFEAADFGALEMDDDRGQVGFFIGFDIFDLCRCAR